MKNRMPIYLDRASINAFVLKKHPEIERSSCYLNTSNQGPFAWVADSTNCRDGREVEIASNDERVDYYGLQIGLIRWRERNGINLLGTDSTLAEAK